ncbi:MAG: glycosyltransferase [Rhizobiaceae bacterium]|nr:glycosyltransferase [Rhizobiaceae bacterium]
MATSVRLADIAEGSQRQELLAALFAPGAGQWSGLAYRLRLPREIVARLVERAERNGTDFLRELLAARYLPAETIYRAIAEETGLGYVDQIAPQRLLTSPDAALTLLSAPRGPYVAKLETPGWSTSHVLAPERMDQLRAVVRRNPGLMDRLKVTSMPALRRALVRRAGPALERMAVDGLSEKLPDFSARVVANAWQGFVLGIAVVALPVAVNVHPEFAYGALHILVSFFFLACVGLRFAAVYAMPAPRRAALETLPVSEMPVYSVVVALYREADVVPDLLSALDRLVWPRSKLEIKLACEADDRVTLDAIAAFALPPWIEVVEIPNVGPRTKPKALAYTLPLTRGDLVVLYDAEDEPHPLQLVEAWQRFRSEGDDLACVQAPLEIGNYDQGLMARMFAFEYAGLFRGLLPWLSDLRALLPLGGTSNHFRREHLEAVGGWDPFNVTEDADLGLRLARFGLRTQMITCATYEDGPNDVRTWLPQRTRWFKGWFQTWLVHMRSPLKLLRELGSVSFVLAQILFAGVWISAFFHPFLVATGIYLAGKLLLHGSLDTWQSAMFAIDVVNVACGYLSFILLGWQTLRGRERLAFWQVVLFTPVYWMLLSLAAWRSVFMLWHRPHQWEKTPHRPARRRHFENLRAR